MRAITKSWFSMGLICMILPGLSQPASSPVDPVRASEWREARPGYEFSFPGDYGAHPDFRVEWWYYTGNLETGSGRRFGYQLTFFRVGVVREPASASRWALRDLHMAHFAISDIERQSFKSFERINRTGIGWAGADAFDQKAPRVAQHTLEPPLRVWNEDWLAQTRGDGYELHAIEEGYSLDLKLMPLKREVINGENGISQRGQSPENASHYYSISRLDSAGKITAGDETFEVTGLSWMDHEFGTSFLGDAQVGWDWFSIQLDDGRDLMLCRMRSLDGTVDPRTSGTLVYADGRSMHLSNEDFSLVAGETWRSPKSGATYPVGWGIDVPRYGLRLKVTAAFEDQELRTPESTGVTYWEGSVAIDGTSEDRRVGGRGYLEMTGYAGQSMGSILR
jgi:predicted secreted hydrolase